MSSSRRGGKSALRAIPFAAQDSVIEAVQGFINSLAEEDSFFPYPVCPTCSGDMVPVKVKLDGEFLIFAWACTCYNLRSPLYEDIVVDDPENFVVNINVYH